MALQGFPFSSLLIDFRIAISGGTAPTPGINNYLRPDGTFTYKRPDGTSVYKRP